MIPVLNPTLANVPVRQLAGSFEGHCVALTEAGEVYTWGPDGRCGQLGHGDREDKIVPTLVKALLPPLTTGSDLLDEANLIHDTQLYPVMRKLRSVFAGSAFSDAGLDADAKMYLDLANVRVGAGVGGARASEQPGRRGGGGC